MGKRHEQSIQISIWSDIQHHQPLLVLLFSHLILFNPRDCSPPVSSVHGISQARILLWDAISFSSGPSPPRDWTHVSCLAGRFFTTEPPGKPREPLGVNLNHKEISLYREMKMYVHTKACMWMFLVAFCGIAPNWKQFRCASIGK